MNNAFRDVLSFHRKFGCHEGTIPATPDVDTIALRVRLMKEEFIELTDAIAEDDLAGVADGAVDLIYVILGTLIAYGIDPAPLWEAVQAANMAKEGGGKRGDGKVKKPPGWVAPDVAGILSTQCSIEAIYPEAA